MRYVVFVACLSVLVGCAITQPGYEIVQMTNPQGDVVYVSKPPDEVLLSEATAKLQAKVPEVKEVLVDASFTVEQKYERVREEIPGLQMVVVLKYLLALDFASGSISLANYEEFTKTIFERFLEEYDQTPATPPDDINALELVEPGMATPIAPPPTRLVVRLVLLHVFLDGSPGKDTWSTWCKINGINYPLWDRKKDISDNCVKTIHAGPGGDRSYCRYVLTDEFEVEVGSRDELSVEFGGMAHDQDDEVMPSKMTFRPEDNWGIGTGSHKWKTVTGMHEMGALNPGQTSYNVYFTIRAL